MPRRETTLEDLWASIEVGLCWQWTGRLHRGYGVVGYQRRPWQTHLLIWDVLVGPIPRGMVLDHLCQNKACCNPDHLEIVTRSENFKRARKAQLA